MLLRFRCKNYRSIRDLVELNLTAATTRSPEREHSLLNTPIEGVKAIRTVVIYGANASGKSNLIDAMRQFWRAVTVSQSKWTPTQGVPISEPFALDQNSKEEDTLFEIDFVVNKQVLNYGFTFDKKSFKSEWLVDVTGSREKTLFRREAREQEIVISFPGKNLAATTKELELLVSIKSQTRSNSLFLSAAAQQNNSFLLEIFKWINLRFRLLGQEGPYFHTQEPELWSNPERKKQIVRLLAFADVGIVDYEIEEKDETEQAQKFSSALLKTLQDFLGAEFYESLENNNSSTRHEVKMLHKGANEKLYSMDINKESAGTRAYFMMLAPIITELSRGGLLLVDELESSLHPLLARQVIRMFNETEFNPLGSQLIFTTHNTHLLDLELFRRDQIWFVDKDQTGSTSLSPLSDYKPRKEQDVAAAYLNGRFGSIPLLDDNHLRAALAGYDHEKLSADRKAW